MIKYTNYLKTLNSNINCLEQKRFISKLTISIKNSFYYINDPKKTF